MRTIKGLASVDWETLVEKAQKFSPVILILVLTTLLLPFLKRRGFTLSPRPPLCVILYQDMLKQLRKSGLVKKASWTAREFLQSTSHLPDTKHDPIRRITEFYEQHRFSNSTIQPGQEKEIRGLIAVL